ncbi:MAG: Sporulation initiation phosphotransferase B [Pelotomaculum sp. PtaB.Bin104]|nr:MAG: Sporulation initiation phosphotransferase B [Pelotomaculum sp. PtaB.Bin104]
MDLNLDNLLEIVQVQRHDFLNHLQVISGLLQLNKVERVREYISQVSMEIARSSKTSQVKIPAVTLALLTCLNEAAKCQIDIELTVNSSFTECRVPGIVAGEAIEHSVGCALEVMAPPEITGRNLDIVLGEKDKKYICRLLFPEPPQINLNQLEARLALIGELLSPHGGRVNLAITTSGIEIFLSFPRQDAKNG